MQGEWGFFEKKGESGGYYPPVRDETIIAG